MSGCCHCHGHLPAISQDNKQKLLAGVPGFHINTQKASKWAAHLSEPGPRRGAGLATDGQSTSV